jgi:hypothetical protein
MPNIIPYIKRQPGDPALVEKIHRATGGVTGVWRVYLEYLSEQRTFVLKYAQQEGKRRVYDHFLLEETEARELTPHAITHRYVNKVYGITSGDPEFDAETEWEEIPF